MAVHPLFVSKERSKKITVLLSTHHKNKFTTAYDVGV